MGSSARTRDLDAELEDIRFDDLDAPPALDEGDWQLHDSPSQPRGDAQAPGRLSLHLELEGLTPDLKRVLGALAGKVIDLPALRIRIKSDDLD